MNFRLFQKLGPGLLYAGAAIGVSHIVQSTRAGAKFGMSMIILVVLVNYLKYPFFQYGTQVAHATGKSLIDGYRQLGKWASITFLGLTLGTALIIQAAVTMVTAGIASYLFPALSPQIWTAVLLLGCLAILWRGQMHFLTVLMKVVMVILSLTTIAAFILSFKWQPPSHGWTDGISFWEPEHLFFLIAFIGWMPAPIDISVWYSVWALEDKKSSQHYLFDFGVGYIGTAVLAICFVGLGSNMLFQSGVELAPTAVGFSKQLIGMYAKCIGPWAAPIIGIAALTTMFSTTLSVMDGISRVMVPAVNAVSPKSTHQRWWNQKRYYLIILSSGTALLIYVFSGNMKQMVDFATTLSFVTAPILAYLNIRAMQLPIIPTASRPQMHPKIISYIGLGVLTLFSLVFLWTKYAR